MNIIKTIRNRWKLRQFRNRLREQAIDYSNSPGQMLRVSKYVDCLIYGHKWTSDFNPEKEMSKPIEKRCYCKRCGAYYHKLKFHEN